MGMEKVIPDVNGGAGGSRYAGRAEVKAAAKKVRRKVSKALIKEQLNNV